MKFLRAESVALAALSFAWRCARLCRINLCTVFKVFSLTLVKFSQQRCAIHHFAAQANQRISLDELTSLELAAATEKISKTLKNFLLPIKK